MFLFFSNKMGCLPSIMLSLLVTAILIYVMSN